MSFSGFSEDDIRKLTKTEVNKSQRVLTKPSLRKVALKPNSSTNNSKSRNILNNVVNKTNNSQAQELPENAKLSVSDKFVKNNNGNARKESVCNLEKVPEVKTSEEEKEVEPEIKNERKFKDLHEFEAKQKLIEEQNRKRKELLAKALADRTKRTQEEAQRLNEIQEEFKMLDAILSCDVKILRKQIEVASVEYMECQKKYQKIEKEFLEAKILLHQKQEKKEMLTEHLCTIIEKNEERKAEKLTELLEKLQINPLNENSVTNEDESKNSKPEVR